MNNRIVETISKALKKVCEKVEDEDGEHLYHSMGWSRELWIDSLGLPAVLPHPRRMSL